MILMHMRPLPLQAKVTAKAAAHASEQRWFWQRAVDTLRDKQQLADLARQAVPDTIGGRKQNQVTNKRPMHSGTQVLPQTCERPYWCPLCRVVEPSDGLPHLSLHHQLHQCDGPGGWVGV